MSGSDPRAWLGRAADSLAAAALLLEEGYPVDSITCSYAAVVAGVRGALTELEMAEDKEPLEAFRLEAAEELGLSPSSRRLPAIIRELQQQVSAGTFWSPTDDITARCIDDVREFLSELAEKVEQRRST